MKRKTFLYQTALASSFFLAHNLFSQLRHSGKTLTGNPLRFPPELASGEKLTLKASNVSVWPNTTAQVIALNNSYPAPTIRVKKGSTFLVNFDNQYTDAATIHWHGIIAPEKMDGHPKDAVLPGKSYTYTFPIVQNAGTYFYHSHAHLNTAKHVYLGFAGFFIVEDDNENQLGLPKGNFDVPLLIQDRRSADIPKFIYQPTQMDIMNGYLGDTPLINGTPNAYLEVHQTLYRFRIVNGSNARVYQLAFSDSRDFWIIATDAGLKDKPAKMKSLFLSPGERIDILADFSSDTIGKSINLRSTAFNGGITGQGTAMDLLRIDVTGSTSSGGIIPQSLSPIIYHNILNSKRTRTFSLSAPMMGGHQINNKSFSMDRIDETVNRDELEEWKIVNTSDDFHPMHLHGAAFQVYARNGSTILSENDKGWKDVVLVFPKETVQVLVKFIDYDALYLFHCHNLEHEDDGMMLNINVTTSTNVAESNNESIPQSFNLEQNYPNPFNPSTTISYYLPSSDRVTLEIYNSLGQQVETLVNEIQEVGQHSVIFSAANLPSGNYFARLHYNTLTQIIKMQLIK